MNFCSWKDRKAVAADLRPIYEAPTADSAEATRTAMPETPRTGCNGYPYSRMKQIPNE